MMLDIFSSFDDHNSTLFNLFPLVWILATLLPLGLTSLLWTKNNPLSSANSFLLTQVSDLISRTQTKNIGGATPVFSALISSLILLNLLGLTPYIFSMTSHLAINLAISLPIWTAIVTMSFSYDLGAFLAHLQPSGSPAPLNPFLCTIELLSLLIRPLTLAVRLTANLSTGHILMALLGTGFVSSPLITSAILIILGTGYFMFEMAVCFIQAYIFTLLPTLYADEHPSQEAH